MQGVERQPLLEGRQAGCWDGILWQLVPYTDCAREEGVQVCIHCGLWEAESHVVSSGHPCWYERWSGRDSSQVVYMTDLLPPFLESIPTEICQHRCHTTGPIKVTLDELR